MPNNALGLGVRKSELELWQVREGTRTVLKTQPISEAISTITLQLRSRFGQFYEFGWQTTESKVQSVSDTWLDGSFLPRWDRAPRIGLSVSGDQKGTSLIQSVHIKYGQPD